MHNQVQLQKKVNFRHALYQVCRFFDRIALTKISIQKMKYEAKLFACHFHLVSFYNHNILAYERFRKTYTYLKNLWN